MTKIYKKRHMKNLWFEEHCEQCGNTIFEGETIYYIYTNLAKPIRKTCKNCGEAIKITEL